MTVEYSPGVVDELKRRVADNLWRWTLPLTTGISLLNISENATFALSAPGREWVLRVHRVGYSSAEEIRSELAWMSALRRDGVIETAAPLPGASGDSVQLLESQTGAPARFAVAFERLPGREPDVRDAVRWFERLGEVTARMHRHAAVWTRPAGFRRKRWDFNSMVGANGFWGPWRAAIGIEPGGMKILERGLDLVRQRLERFGQSADVFGLVHADLRLANLLVDDVRLRVIDFDDCGFSWYLYDFAAAVSFIEHQPTLPDLLHAWLCGYCKIIQLTAAARAEIPTFVLLRRVLLSAWLASHGEVPFAREFGAAHTQGTVALADAFLRGGFLSSAEK